MSPEPSWVPFSLSSHAGNGCTEDREGLTCTNRHTPPVWMPRQRTEKLQWEHAQRERVIIPTIILIHLNAAEVVILAYLSFRRQPSVCHRKQQDVLKMWPLIKEMLSVTATIPVSGCRVSVTSPKKALLKHEHLLKKMKCLQQNIMSNSLRHGTTPLQTFPCFLCASLCQERCEDMDWHTISSPKPSSSSSTD